jgi:stearoyl-CoA desaturase (delta-9 desaturase)
MMLRKGGRRAGQPSPPIVRIRRPLTLDEKPDILGNLGFLGIHVFCLAVFFTGWSSVAVAVAVLTYVVRAFGLTAGYHRYFAHRGFKAGRGFQFVLAFIGATAAQKGPLWWAAHHRHHHRFADTEHDIHSPGVRGFLWAHVGWVLAPKNEPTKYQSIPDFAKFPELVALNRWHYVAPASLVVALLLLGQVLAVYAPSLGTGPLQMAVWGFGISTVCLYHATFFVNSLAHVSGSRRFKTRDDSRNNWFISLITLGEGWHNNHHRYPSSERQGFYWWELDMTHYVLRVLSWLGLVWDLRAPPQEIYEEARTGAALVSQSDREAA